MHTKFRVSGMIQVFALAMVFAGGASAATINVSTWAELTGAPGDTAVSGDVVVLAAGNYTVTGTKNMTEGVIYQGAGDTTLIDGAGAFRVFQAPITVNPPETTSVGTWTLESVKIINGGVGNQGAFRGFATDGMGPETFSPQDLNLTNVTFENCISTADGAAAQFRKGTLTITDCTFKDCATTQRDGGAVNGGAQGDATLNVTGCVFTNCDSADDGGGIYMNGPNGTLNITGCEFTDCDTTAPLGDDAGAVFMDDGDGTLVITDSTFTNCTSADDGGAIRTAGDGTSVTIDGCTFDGNSSGDDGGHVDIQNDSSAFIMNSVFLNGHATARVGAVRMQDDLAIECHITNCLFADNTADEMFAVMQKGTTLIESVNNTFVNNTSTTGGGILRLVHFDANTASIVCSNNIFLNNTVLADALDGAPGLVSSWEVQGNTATDFKVTNNNFFGNTIPAAWPLVVSSLVDGLNAATSGLTAGSFPPVIAETGRITADPALDFEHKPTAASTAIIDAADPTTATAADLEGTFAVGLRDVGAYELSAPIAPASHNWNWNLYE